MAISKEDILEAVGAMSVMDLNDLVKAFEEKFGVSAAAMAVAGPAGGGAGGGAAAEEQTEFNVSWFEGVNLNYAEHIFRNFTNERPAIVFKSESGSINEITWEELRNKTASLQQHFKAWKIAAGDRGVALLPCIPEATVAMLATVS